MTLGLLFEDKDPLLLTSGLSPLRTDLENAHVSNNPEEEMDYNLLASPTQSDKDEVSGSWTDQ
jgi:hypothetical protein